MCVCVYVLLWTHTCPPPTLALQSPLHLLACGPPILTHTPVHTHILTTLPLQQPQQATSRNTRLRSEKYNKNITKRGNVPVGTAAVRTYTLTHASTDRPAIVVHCALQDPHPASHTLLHTTPTDHNTETRGCPARQPSFVGTAPLCGGWLCDLPNHPDSKKWTRLLNKKEAMDRETHSHRDHRSMDLPTYIPTYTRTLYKSKPHFFSSKEDCNGCKLACVTCIYFVTRTRKKRKQKPETINITHLHTPHVVLFFFIVVIASFDFVCLHSPLSLFAFFFQSKPFLSW